MSQVITLPFSFDSLEPIIDAQTVQLHYSKHHQGYGAKLTAALQDQEGWLDKRLVEILLNIKDLPEDLQTKVFNNGGQVYNHNLYWESLSPDGSQRPANRSAILEAIQKDFGSFEDFEDKFVQAGLTQFGSGWAWLSVNSDKKLEVSNTSNADNPLLSKGSTPILTLDVWEHAYYLKYKNLRPDYIKAFMTKINWSGVNQKYQAAVD